MNITDRPTPTTDDMRDEITSNRDCAFLLLDKLAVMEQQRDAAVEALEAIAMSDTTDLENLLRQLGAAEHPEAWGSDEDITELARNSADALAAQRQRIAELERDVQAYRGALGYAVPDSFGDRLTDGTIPNNGIAEALHQQAAAERERADANAKDAERYRWLREQMTHEHSGPHVGWTLGFVMPGDDTDAAIDAARKGQP